MSRDATPISSSAESLEWTQGWRIAAPLTVAVLIGVLVLYWDTVVFTVKYWERRSYGHGYLLVPISIFMIWHSRAAFARLEPRPQPWAAPLLLAASLAWAIAWFLDIQLGMQLSLLAVIGLVAWLLLGNRVGWLLVMPIGYLLFGIPLWSLLTPYLQDNTAVAAAGILQAMGVPVFLESFYISIPSGQFIVEQVCAGLRYLLATMSIAALFAYLNFRRVWLGILFFLSCVAFSMILNWLRVVTIIGVGYLSEMQHWLVRDHLTFGWTLFAVGLVPMFVYGIWLQRFDRAAPEGAPAPEAAAPATVSASRFGFWGAIALVLASAGPVAAFLSTSGSAVHVAVDLPVPAAAAPWTRAPDSDYAWHPKYVGADASIQAVYGLGDTRVSLYIAYYAHQREGAELINQLNALYDGSTWRRDAQRTRRIALADGTRLSIREVELVAATGERRLVWYWYRVGGRRASQPLEAKLLQLWGTLKGSPSAAVIAVSAPVGSSVPDTRADLESFLSAMDSTVTRSIVRASSPD